MGFNAGIISNEIAVFGGIKASGVGRETRDMVLTDYTELK